MDADGNPRFSDDPNAPDTGDPGQTGFPVVDMGAFEVLMLVGDFDGSGVVDLADFSMLSGCFAGPVLLSGDLDANGAVELADHALMSFCLGGPLTSPDAACRAADLDRDGDADLADFGVLQVGFAQQLPPLEGDCAATDLDGDRDVDATDFAAFQMVFPAGAGSLRPATAYLPEF